MIKKGVHKRHPNSGRKGKYNERTKVYSIRGPISQEATVKKLAKEYLKQFEVNQ